MQPFFTACMYNMHVTSLYLKCRTNGFQTSTGPIVFIFHLLTQILPLARNNELHSQIRNDLHDWFHELYSNCTLFWCCSVHLTHLAKHYLYLVCLFSFMAIALKILNG